MPGTRGASLKKLTCLHEPEADHHRKHYRYYFHVPKFENILTLSGRILELADGLFQHVNLSEFSLLLLLFFSIRHLCRKQSSLEVVAVL